MTTLQKTILVLGATGQQGGAVAAHLLADGWQVRAFTRDPSSKAAQTLAQAGAQLFRGDLGDRVSLDAAMQGVHGVFSVQPPTWEPSDARTAEEIRWGKNAADAAKDAGVQHFVYSSNSGADVQSRFRYFAKWEIEQYIKTLGLPATILRPSGFMESYASPFYGIQHGTLAEATNPDVPVYCIAVDDIGAFVKLAFKHPGEFLGKTIEIAGDARTPPSIASAITRATGRPISYVQIPIETIRQHNETLARIYEWLNGDGYEVDFPTLRSLHPGLMDFDTWLEKKGKAMFEVLFQTNQTN
ncbi:NmrA/HSCARG family protein [Paenibacillus sp. S28]|uniref:NmrA/HSCARG family protein n=1 Tax=Paenibacillus sp. S28 TaxID=2767463 RepID=UPI00190A4962|nr:NmrA/HSCARG family protein [Paenibacillus sp. S28]MBJ9990823.1 NmrA/HSCARG family protein [Paenibacillus sp. S28]